jgi:hypothetical protein
MSPARLELKHPSGWFAAGHEVRLAATVLSDGAFKLFVWLCLHAERNTGRLRLEVRDIACSLQKTERDIERGIHELLNTGVCRFVHGSVEVQERFWPYRRDLTAVKISDPGDYVAAVRRVFLKHGCVSSSFSPADERLAAEWCRRGVSFEQVERAIYLGVARKYAALLNNGKGSPITALSYFAHLIEEVEQQSVSPDYWRHVKARCEQFDRRWKASKSAAKAQSAPAGETK